MARTVPMARIGNALNEIISDMKDNEIRKTRSAIKATLIDRWGDIIIRTPVDTGRARGAWLIDTIERSDTGQKSKRKGANYVAKSISSIDVLKNSVYLVNNLPYAAVLEYGDYPKNPKKGTFNKKTGRYEKRTKGGFSKLAPKGMVRVSLLSFGRVLKREYKKRVGRGI